MFKNPLDFIKEMHANEVRVGLNLDGSEGINKMNDGYLKMCEELNNPTDKLIPFKVLDKEFIVSYLNNLIDPLYKIGIDFFWINYRNLRDKTSNSVLNYYHFNDFKKFKDKRVVKELVEKNTQFSKSFKLNDGTIKSVFGSSPINYYDETEKVWKEIDSTLKEEGENYVSNLGKYKAKIKKGGEIAGVTVGDENTYVEWQFLGTKIENKYA